MPIKTMIMVEKMDDEKFNCLYLGQTYLTIAILVVLAIQLLLTGILIFYIRKLYFEVKNHPPNPVENAGTVRQQSNTSNQRPRSLWKEIDYLTRYAGSGVVNTLVGFAVIFSAMALGISPVISNIAGYAVGFILGFVLSKKFVFRSDGHFVTESVRYLIAFALSFLFNLLVLRFALLYLHLHAMVSQVLSAVSYTLLMYLLTRLFVFGTAKPNQL